MAGIMCAGTSAKSRMTAAQNSVAGLDRAIGTTLTQFCQCSLLESCGSLVAGSVEALRRGAEHACTGIFGAVDAVSEAHELFLAVEDSLDQCAGVAGLLGLFDHRKNAGQVRRRAAGRTSRRWRRKAKPRRRRPWRR